MANAKSDLTFRIFGKDVSASKTLKGVGTQANKTGKGLGGVVAGFGGMAGIATAAAAGAAAVGYALYDAATAAAEDQSASKKLAKTLKNVTGATDDQVEAVENYIDATQRATGVADDELRPAFGNLVRATEDAQVAQELMNTALDVAAGTGKPVETIAIALAKAYNGNTGALGRLGIQMKDSKGKALPFKDALKKLNDQFGGQAADQAGTYEGKMKRVGIAFDELKENIGAKVLPVLDTLATWLAEEGVPKLEALWETIETKVIPVISEYLKPVVEGIQTAFSDMGKTVEDNRDFFNDLMTVAKPLAAFAGGQMAVSLKILAGMFRAVTEAAVFARDVFLKVKGAATNVAGAIGKAIGTMTGYIRGAIGGIRSLWNSTIGGKGFSFPSWLSYLPGVSGLAGQSFNIPFLADGAIVNGPTLAMIGEGQYPEAVVPLKPGMGLGGGTVIELHVHGNAYGPGSGRWLANEIDKAVAGTTYRPNRLATR